MRKVTYAKLQGLEAFIPGIGGLGTTLPPQKTIPGGFTMYEDDGMLLLVLGGTKGIKEIKAGIPLTNVQVFVYAPEEPSERAKA